MATAQAAIRASRATAANRCDAPPPFQDHAPQFFPCVAGQPMILTGFASTSPRRLRNLGAKMGSDPAMTATRALGHLLLGLTCCRRIVELDEVAPAAGPGPTTAENIRTKNKNLFRSLGKCKDKALPKAPRPFID